MENTYKTPLNQRLNAKKYYEKNRSAINAKCRAYSHMYYSDPVNRARHLAKMKERYHANKKNALVA